MCHIVRAGYVRNLNEESNEVVIVGVHRYRRTAGAEGTCAATTSRE